MSAYALPMQELIDELGRLPGIGPKSAQRIAYHLLKRAKEDTVRLARTIESTRERITFCTRCFNLAEADPPGTDAECAICRDHRRDGHLLCVVEEPKDVIAVERTQEFRGLYHVLQGVLDPLQGVGPEHLRIRELLRRIDLEAITEVILCTNPTLDGETTALYLARLLKPLGLTVSRIASGLPVGAELEYADQLTLGRALEGRRIFDA